ncbi:BA75_03397T0 [Komagataella pastoris]|uniref:Inosine triphosphate pyrophosphatase n=1 Tax=Komagataella pastoris TaxID=4922 RepID=A0A1B2JET5_PICPA|nr:BA75_03397T0 [Komagataella pastoris]
MKKLTFVTGNSNKLKEFLAIVNGSEETSTVGDYEIVCQSVDLPELQGSIDTVVIHKAKSAADLISGPVIVEDTCLGFDALNDLPGPYIKWFLKSIGLEGLNKMLEGFENKSAKAYCTFGYCEGPGENVKLFQGITEGKIVTPRGPTKFGWDPIFQPLGFNQTFAEMDNATKNSISHRFKAVEKLRFFLLES